MISKVKKRFLKDVLDQVNFVFDHGSIRKELLQHMEDLEEHFEPSAHKDLQVDSWVIQEMGDARLIGRQLNRVHNPWLGWLWVASQVVLVLMVVISLRTFYTEQMSAMNHLSAISDQGIDFKDVFHFQNAEVKPSDVVDVDIHEPFQLNEYTVILERIVYEPSGHLAILYQTTRPYRLLQAKLPTPNLNMNSSITLNDGRVFYPVNDVFAVYRNEIIAIYFKLPDDQFSSFTFNYDETVLNIAYTYEVPA